MTVTFLNPPDLVLSETLTDVLYAQMVELSHYDGGHQFDYLLCQPTHNYLQLEHLGYVIIVDKDHPHGWQKIAKLTQIGKSKIGDITTQRRRRRRRG